jgi:hypothetical protein
VDWHRGKTDDAVEEENQSNRDDADASLYLPDWIPLQIVT